MKKRSTTTEAGDYNEVLSDKELCVRLGISYGTLLNYLKNGPPQVRHEVHPDIRDIKRRVWRGRRGWFLNSVEQFEQSHHIGEHHGIESCKHQ